MKTKNLQTINTSSDKLVFFNSPSPLKDMTRSNLHHGSCLPDKIESIYLPLATTVNVISILPKIWRPKPKNNDKPMIFY